VCARKKSFFFFFFFCLWGKCCAFELGKNEKKNAISFFFRDLSIREIRKYYFTPFFYI